MIALTMSTITWYIFFIVTPCKKVCAYGALNQLRRSIELSMLRCRLDMWKGMSFVSIPKMMVCACFHPYVFWTKRKAEGLVALGLHQRNLLFVLSKKLFLTNTSCARFCHFNFFRLLVFWDNSFQKHFKHAVHHFRVLNFDLIFESKCPCEIA